MTFFKQIVIILMKIDKQMLERAETRNSNGCQLMGRRSSRFQMFLEIDSLKNFAIFTRKHLRWSLFLIKMQALDLQLY